MYLCHVGTFSQLPADTNLTGQEHRACPGKVRALRRSEMVSPERAALSYYANDSKSANLAIIVKMKARSVKKQRNDVIIIKLYCQTVEKVLY